MLWTLPLVSLFLSTTLARPTSDQFIFSNPVDSPLSLISLPLQLSQSIIPLIEQLPVDHREQLVQHLKEWEEPRRVTLRGRDGQQSISIDLTEGQKSLLTLANIRFVDVTDDNDEEDRASFSPSSSKEIYPSTLTHNSSSLTPLFSTISIPEMQQFLSKFTSFYNRYYRSSTGRESQLFLLEHLKSSHQTLNPKAKVTFREFQHGWTQKSIIVRWEPKDCGKKEMKEKDEGVVILSAHQDSTNTLPFLRAPGADDDASGTVTLIQTFTQLLRHGYEPTERAVEFMFFSAEEGGLLGSGEVAKSYREEGKKVKAMFHMDVVAYVKPGTTPVIGLITDGVSDDLTEYMKLLIDEYAQIPYATTQCGYGCSDFASFTKNGFRSTCLAEGKFADSNPNMHSTSDTTSLEGYSFEHIREFVRVAIGYSVELGGFEKMKSKKKGSEGKWRME